MPDDLLAEYEKPAETAPDEVKLLRIFESVCNGFAPGKGNGLYLMYRALSGICHPSVSAVSRHYDLEPQADAGLVLTLNGGEEEAHILYTLAASLIWAGRAIDYNVKDRPPAGGTEAGSTPDGRSLNAQARGVARFHQVPEAASISPGVTPPSWIPYTAGVDHRASLAVRANPRRPDRPICAAGGKPSATCSRISECCRWVISHAE